MWVYPEIRYLADLLPYHAARTPARLALMFEGQAYSYADVDEQSNKVANALCARGVKRKDRVAFYGRNSADFFLALFGVAKSGGAFCRSTGGWRPTSWLPSWPMPARYLPS